MRAWSVIVSIGSLLLIGSGAGLTNYFNCLQNTPQSIWCGYGSGWDATVFNLNVAMALIGIAMAIVAFPVYRAEKSAMTQYLLNTRPCKRCGKLMTILDEERLYCHKDDLLFYARENRWSD